MAENREVRVFHWTPADDEDWIYVEPLGNALVYGDMVSVGGDQSVRLCMGGREAWIRRPGLHTVGLDERGEAEILRAHMMGEDLGEISMMVNTSITFCSLREYSYPVEAKDYVMINRMIGLKPTFDMRFHISDEERLLSCVRPGTAIKDQVLEAFAACLSAELEKRIKDSGVFDEYSDRETVEAALRNEEYANALTGTLREAVSDTPFGITVDEVRIAGVAKWGLWSGFCDVCGAAVGRRDRRCRNGHPIARCPQCREPIYDGQCKMNGHSVLYCHECGQYVVAYEGACPLHRHSRL